MKDGIYNAQVVNARLSTGDYGLLTGTLTVKYEGAYQGFGSYCLYNPRNDKNNENRYCGAWIYRVMQVTGVTEWEALGGQAVRVQIENGIIKALGHFMDDNWFDPRVELS